MKIAKTNLMVQGLEINCEILKLVPDQLEQELAAAQEIIELLESKSRDVLN